MKDYQEFIREKAVWQHGDGFDPVALNSMLFPFQEFMTRWALQKGRAGIFADCGMGKTAMQLAWADEIMKRTNKPVLITTPIAVGAQTIREAIKFGIEAKRSRDGQMTSEVCVWVTNYQQLHKFDPSRFGGIVCDESSAIKHFKSQTRGTVNEFVKPIRFRLLCTATAAPNDFWELGTSSEALGLLGFRDMITTFFKQETSKDHLGWGRTKYRFRGHAEEPFWAWVCSWARSLRMPSDLGFADDGFILPELIENEYVVESNKSRPGRLFPMPGENIQDERAERRLSLRERCDKAVEIAEAAGGRPVVLWCELNDESERLTKVVPGAVEVTGSMPDEKKEELLTAFGSGQIQRIVLKPKIGAWGLNWQHCSDVIDFPSHSYEQYYQKVRRCYRFGQKRPVTVSTICSEGEAGILNSLKRKASQADRMFSAIVSHMKDAMHLASNDFYPEKEEVPEWLSCGK